MSQGSRVTVTVTDGNKKFYRRVSKAERPIMVRLTLGQWLE